MPSQSQVLRLLAMSVVLGVLGGTTGSLLMAVIDHGQEWVFTDLPQSLGLDGAPWWWVLLVLLLSAALVAVIRRLPGATGTGPLTGFHFDDPLVIVPSVLLAALATLILGMSLGPEAPLIVLGSAVGAIVARRADPQTQRAFMMLGGVAAIGSVFGNPFISAFMILEFAAMGVVPAMLISPVLLALGASYITQIGIGRIPGFGVHSLSVPGLPDFTEVRPGDLLLSLVVALVAAGVAMAAREGGLAVARFASRRAVAALFGAALVTAVVAIVATSGFGVELNQILFSGNSGMADLLAQSSITAVIVILVGKAIAYAVALGGGFRGGPIFPATFLGVAVAVLATLILPSDSVSAMAAAGIAASAAAMLKLPATSALLGAVLVAGAGAAIAPFAIIGATIGFLIRMMVDRKVGEPAPTSEAHA